MTETYLGVRIDKDRDKLLSEQSEKLLTEYYCREDETSPQMAFARAANAYSYGDKKLAQKIYDGASKGWFMFASPVLSNAPLPKEKVKALPISCFLAYVPDSLEGLIDHSAELRWLSVKGGGVGGHWSSVRSVSDIAPGPIPFLHTVDADMIAYRQGKTRKGSYAAYMDISHPDILEFLQMRIPTGDVGRKCLNIHHAVNVTDEFMTAVDKGADWNLLDPNDRSVRETMTARKLWELVLETRFRTGEPYINFIDTANHALPQTMKDKGLKINGSNLCNEIHLPTSEDRTAVCCLSSLNLEKYDEWKDTTLVKDLIRYLDNVLQFFMIVSCSPSIEPHKANAYTHRTRAGSHLIKNRYLEEELIKLNMDKPEIWTSIITNGGSVQQLEFLSEETKNIFKTAIEINQNVIVEMAGNRQRYLCQGQSLNVFFPAGASKRYLHEVHFKAWGAGCKGLYYLRTETSNRAENVAEKIELNKLTDLTDIAKEEDECVACQG